MTLVRMKAAAAGAATGVPALDSWMLVLLALLVGAGGIVLIRRKVQ